MVLETLKDQDLVHYGKLHKASNAYLGPGDQVLMMNSKFCRSLKTW